MNATAWVSLIACAGQLALSLLALRVVQKPLGLPLMLLSLTFFTWNFASLAYALSGVPGWHWFDATVSSWTSPLAFYFILTFVGRRRELRWLNVASYVIFGALSLSALAAFVFPWAQPWVGSRFAKAHFALITPMVILSAVLLVSHLKKARSPQELARTQLLLLALGVMAVFASTELLGDLGLEVMRLGNVGILLGTALMALITYRFNLLDTERAPTVMLTAAALAASSVLAYWLIFLGFGSSTALWLVGTGTVTLALMAAVRKVASLLRTTRERVERFVTLGRFSAQLAHDLKNPLAALKGAAQYLKEEAHQGRMGASPEQQEFVELILEQSARLERVVDRYQRLGRVEPLKATVAVNGLVRGVMGLQTFASGGEVKLHAELSDGLPELHADPDLLAGALENLLRNAFEAMPRGGDVTVRTRLERDAGGSAVVLEVEDSGVGMDARTRERAFDDFFTSKEHGTGMGLAFVRRVVDAHGGEVALYSEEGKGSRFVVRLPV